MRLYGELADWWPLVSPAQDYAPESAAYRALLEDACAPATVLELGSGGGHVASHLKAHCELTLVDLSPGMLDVSRALNPECEHVQGDMRDVRLGRTFDAVFAQDALMYLRTEEDLRAAVATAAAHCRPGGAVLLAPDWTAETFRAGCSQGGADGVGRALRWLEWTHDRDPDDGVFETEYAFLLREGEQPVRTVHDHHVLGLFPAATWEAACRAAGLEPEPRELPLDDDAGSRVFLCGRPA